MPPDVNAEFAAVAPEPADLVPIKQAARAVRKRLSAVKDLVEAGKLTAWRNGGNDAHPRLRVSLAALRAVLWNESVYRPPRAGREPDAKPTTIHPDALKMLAPRRPRPARATG